MRVLGVDFTSRPRRVKPITCAEGRYLRGTLAVESVRRIEDFAGFEQLLRENGPWVGGFDFPFGLPRELIGQLGWPHDWKQYVAAVARLGRENFRRLLDEVRAARPVGAKYLHRATDLPARSSSPMKLVNPPVALMFFEGAPRLAASGVSVQPCASGDPARIALEAYPAMLARRITRSSYKSDTKHEQNRSRADARRRIVSMLCRDAREILGFDLVLSRAVGRAARDDASGDSLDSVLCAAQAAWGWRLRARGYGIASDADALEGWIVGPMKIPAFRNLPAATAA